MYKSRRVPFSLFVNIPLTTPRINFRISECHHRFSIDLIVIFSAKNGKLFLDHTDPLKHDVDKGGVMTGGRGLLVIRYCLYSVLGVTPSCKHVNFPIPMILLLRLVFYLCSDLSSTTTNGSLNIIWAWSSVSYH